MKVLVWPNPILKQVSKTATKPVDPVFLAELHAMMRAKGGVGLSAIQVGIPERWFIYSVGNGPQIAYDPVWVTVPNFDVRPLPTREGCLSTPGQYEIVPRWYTVGVQYGTSPLGCVGGKCVNRVVTGLEAQLFQHEREHLDGKMFVDHLPSADRSRILGAMQKFKRQSGAKY